MTLVLPARLPTGELNAPAIARVATLLRAGRLVAIPTETVYGLGANALDADAVRSIFAAKGRPAFNPLIVHVLGEAQAMALCESWPDAARRLAAAFWPGPLSLVVPKSDRIPSEVTAGARTVALRAPAHQVARAVIEAAGVPIAAPSANRSNGVSPTTAAHVLRSLGDRIDAVLDAGPCEVGIESTVIDLTDEPTLLRPGAISAEQLASIIGRVRTHDGVVEAGVRASPGLMARHYSPDAETRLFDVPDLRTTLATLPTSARIGGLVRRVARPDDRRIVSWEALGDDPVDFARNLYAALHRIELAGATHVLLERAPRVGTWAAVADRLTRAAGESA